MRPGKKSLTVLLSSLLLVSNASVALGNENVDVKSSNGLESKIEKIRAELTKETTPEIFKEIDNIKKPVEYKDDDQVRIIVELDGKTPVEYATEQNVMYKDLSENKKSTLLSEVNSKKDSIKNSIASNGIDLNYQNDFSVSFIGFSGLVKYKDIQRLESVNGVKNVYLANEYEKPTPQMTKSHQFIQSIQTWADGGYQGEGMVVAVIDSGVDPSHRDFVVTDKETTKLKQDKVDSLVSSKGLKGKFFTDKVPYGYNYFDKDEEILDLGPGASEHGMHVAGTVAANGDTKNGGIKGVAPEAQVLGMKVFSNDPKYPSTYSDIYLKAIDDSIALGADVLNMSLGSTASFYFENSPEDVALKNAVANGVVAAVSAGNSGYNGRDWDMPLYQNQDIGLVGSPGLNKDTIQVAASGNAISEFTTTVKTSAGQSFPGYGVDDWEEAKDLEVVSLAALNGKTDEDGKNCTVCGVPEDYKNVDVKGKVVLVKRGNLSFADKTKNAKAAGAKGIIVSDAGLSTFFYDQGGWGLPFMLISATDGKNLDQAIRSKEKVTFSTTTSNKKDSPEYGKLTDFSSWGTTPTLELKPEITAPGGGIWSTLQNNQYGSMSGTSMASPHVAGGAALVQQYLQKTHPELGIEERTRLVKNLLMSTAELIIDKNGNVSSPRNQGAGMMQIYDAVSTPVYVTRKGSSESKVELKEFTAKQISFDVTAHNMSAEEMTYNVNANVLADQFFEKDGKTYNAMTTGDLTKSGAKVSAPKSIKVPANGKVDFTVSVDLTNAKVQGKDADGKAKTMDLKEDIFIEGFVTLTDAAGLKSDLSIPYIGFYGKWDRLNIVDGFKSLGENRYFDLAKLFGRTAGEAYDTKNEFIAPIEKDGKKVYAISPNNDDKMEGFLPLPSILRNAGELQFNILDENGNPLQRLSTENNVRKNYYSPGNKIYPLSIGAKRLWTGKVNNELVKDGMYYYEIKAKSPTNNAEWQSKKIPLLVDTTDPEVNVSYDKVTKKISWQVKEEGSGIKNIGIFVNGKLIVVNPKEASIDLPEIDGDEILIEVMAIDKVENVGFGDLVTDNIIDPVVALNASTPEEYSVNKEGKVLVKGTIDEQKGLDKLTVNGKEVETKYNADKKYYEFETTVSFDKDGQHEILVKAVNVAGKEHQVTRQIYVDTTAGNISLEAPATVPHDTEKVEVKVTLKDNFNFLDFYVDGKQEFHHDGADKTTYATPVEKELTLPLTLKEGENKFNLKLVDKAGHETLKEVKITRSAKTPPVVVDKGWVKKDGKWFFYNDKGVMQTGWVKDGSKWYFLASNGVMQTGWVKDGKTWYYLAANGAMQTGWVKDGKTWYYLAANGAMQTGWVKDGKTWYYLAANGAMQTGWVKDGGKWYYLASNGAMQTGWLKEGNKWYYLSANGSMVTGWVTIGGKKYYFNASGVWVK